MKKGIAFSFLNAEKEIPRALDPWVERGYTIAAVDGRYKTPLPPHIAAKIKSNYSTDNSEDLLKKRYPNANIIYDKLFGTQLQKRQRTFDILGEEKCDIGITWDSDDYIYQRYQDWDRFNKELEAMAASECETLTAYMHAWIPSDELWPKQWNGVHSNTWHKYVRVHKNPGDQAYVLNHYTFTTKEILKQVTEQEIGYWAVLYGIQHRLGVERPSINHPLLKGNAKRILDGIRITTDRRYRAKDAKEFGENWAFQETREDDCKRINNWRNVHGGTPPIELDKPHYFDPDGRIVFIENRPEQNEYIMNPLDSKTVDGVRITTDRKFRDTDQLEYGDGWAFQEMHEDRAKEAYLVWDIQAYPPPPRNLNSWLDLLDEPHYYNQDERRIAIV